MKRAQLSIKARLCLFKSKSFQFLLIILVVLSINSCKKDLLLPNDQLLNSNKNVKIENISYSKFLGAIDLGTTGNLKEMLLKPVGGSREKLSSLTAPSDQESLYNIDPVLVKKLTIRMRPVMSSV